MKLSAPVYRLKRRAKALSREKNIPHSQALDIVATKEGFSSWSLLVARMADDTPAQELLAQLTPGDLVLLGARPGQGKTLMSLELIAEAIKTGRPGVFFTLEYTKNDVLERLKEVGKGSIGLDDRFEFDGSDQINSDHIKERLALASPGTVVIVDYLQLLDQRRDNPELAVQIEALKSFATRRGLIIVFISQIDRSFNPAIKSFPDIDDVRLPNPLELALFDKTCFLNNGSVQINATK